MSSLIPDWLVDREQTDPTSSQIIGWWESRRFLYNVCVGSAGVFTCIIALIMAVIVESTGREPIFPDPPLFALFGIIMYGIGANVCYTLGWICELAARRAWPEMASAFGGLSFAIGLIGSVVLTLVPAVLVTLLSIVVMFTRAPTIPH